jgi:L-aspartate oxidase
MIVVIGTGVAGLTAADHLASAGAEVTLMTAGRFGVDAVAAGNTALAQGGIAAAIGPRDTPSAHADDTIAAGAGLVEPAVATLLAEEGALRVHELLAAGFPADRDAAGRLIFGLEGAHSTARIIHAGEDRSGAVLSAFLTARVQKHIKCGRISLIQQASVTQFTTTTGRATGVCYATPAGTQRLDADAVILATGGYAGLFATTSASAAVTGHGILAAALAGAVLADMEFIQFHPTVLPSTGELISEAVRGAGAVLRDPMGHRYMTDHHPDAELAPRDVVSRASFAAMREFDVSTVWLDATVIEHRHGSGTLATRFPVLTHRLAAHGLDWTKHWVPVAPAAHYCMGGVATDTWARSSVAGLYAAGEAASTGVHGANRLASNSLLEGLVFGARAARSAQQYLHCGDWELDIYMTDLLAMAQQVPYKSSSSPLDAEVDLRCLVQKYVGMQRTQTGLTTLLDTLDHVDHSLAPLIRVIATAALARTESRGGHWRADHLNTDPAQATRTAWYLTPTGTLQHPDIDLVTEHKERFFHVDV